MINRLLLFVAFFLSISSAVMHTPALVGSVSSIYEAPICRQLGCIYQGVRRSRLEGSNNRVRIYQYGLASGQHIEVTRYDLPGQPGHNRIYTVRYTAMVSGRTANDAARLASVAAGYEVQATLVSACWRAARGPTRSASERIVVSRGFEAPSVSCAVKESEASILIQLTN